MSDPILHLLVGPNGAGKSTLAGQLQAAMPGLEFVNADVIARDRWGDEELTHAYEAAALASARREELLRERRSFIAETVFSHPSKLDLLRDAAAAGYIVTLHVVVIPEDLAVARVASRVEVGGHDVPEDKIRDRHRRLWAFVVDAIGLAHESIVYDNSRAVRPLRIVARCDAGIATTSPQWPSWFPDVLVAIAP